MIEMVIPYKEIVEKDLRQQSAVFDMSLKSPEKNLLKTMGDSDIYLDLGLAYNPSDLN